MITDACFLTFGRNFAFKIQNGKKNKLVEISFHWNEMFLVLLYNPFTFPFVNKIICFHKSDMKWFSCILFLMSGNPLQGMPGSKVGPVPIVQMYGVTMEGNSVLCHIHGFVPYFYVPAPPEFQRSHCNAFQDGLNKAVLNDMRSNKDNITQVNEYCKENGALSMDFLTPITPGSSP